MVYTFHYTGSAGSELFATPFPCCVLPNFIQDQDGFLDSLKDDILRLKYYDKDNDLYQFHQACVFMCIVHVCIVLFIVFMCIVHVCIVLFIVFNVTV